jgi:hypothetical protein
MASAADFGWPHGGLGDFARFRAAIGNETKGGGDVFDPR